MLDYLIVGQGLAGSLLAHELLKTGQTVLVVDGGHQGAASKVAAGIINPITGRRYVKSWRIDELLPAAREIYRELETQMGVSIFNERNILRALFNQREENDWQLRMADESYAPFLRTHPDLEKYHSQTIPAFAYGEVTQSAQVDLPRLVVEYRYWLQSRASLLDETFDFDALSFEGEAPVYKGLRPRRIVFCEGYRGAANPFFGHLPFGGAKGEVLHVDIPGIFFVKMLKHRVFIVPLTSGLYWVGSAYEWQYPDDLPTPEGRAYIEERLRDFLKPSFRVEDHLAAVRPTVKDRRPFLGQHPAHPALYLFNGLGTKGASLGPFFARQMADYLLGRRPVDREVDIRRFD